jgi:hypothetical protein
MFLHVMFLFGHMYLINHHCIWIHHTLYLRYTRSVSQKRRIRCIWLYLRYISDTTRYVSKMYLRYSQIHQIRIWIHQTQYLRYTKSVSQKRRIRCIWLYLRYTSDTYLAVSEMYLRYTRYSQIQPDTYPDTYPVSEV